MELENRIQDLTAETEADQNLLKEYRKKNHEKLT